MQIRHATVDDARGIAGVHVGSWRRAYEGLLPADDLAALDIGQFAAWRARRTEAMDRTNSATLVVEDEEGIAGFVDVGPTRDEHLDPTRVAELYAIYLEPSRWDRGYGRELIAAAEDAMRVELAFESGMLWVLEDNTRARRFYEAAGWEHDGGRQLETVLSAQVYEVRYAKSFS